MNCMETNKRMFEFINNSPTCYHAVKNAAERLETAGFQELCEKEDFLLENGKKYYVKA